MAINSSLLLDGAPINESGSFIESIGRGIGNAFTGDLDYARQLELQSISNAFSAAEAQKTRDFNALEAQKARDFSERMSSSAYQRAMADMKAAGLNPALAFSQGGASTPSASVASANSAHGASASAGKSGEGFRAIGNILTALLGGAFRVATTSMMNEAMMAQTLERSSTAYGIAKLNSDSAYEVALERDLEHMRRDNAWRAFYSRKR